MYKLTRACKVLPKVITAVQRAITVVEPCYDILIWHRLRLDGFRTRCCTSLAEDKNIPCSDKTLVNPKEEQPDYYSRIRVYKFLHTDSSTDSDSDGCERLEAELKAIAMGEEEALNEMEILAKYKEEELYRYDPSIKYEVLRRFDVTKFVVSEDSSTELSDSESDTQTET